ncbi:MAG TPA: DeoR/GlpR family DNA-binding transcription regulator [Candidatus Limnocylindrales bacterium]
MAELGDEPVVVLPTSLRRDRVFETIRRHEFVSVADLSDAFGVSEVTIRSDLEALAEDGKIRRVRGGAIHRATVSREPSYEQQAEASGGEKERIGEAAAAMVESGQTIILDASPTTAAVARALAARTDLRDVHVFTNGLRIALELEPAIPHVTVIVTGGTLRRMQHSLVNPLGNVILDQIHAHVAFVGCDGIEAEAGVTNTSVADVEIKRLMLRAGRRRVVVAEGSTVGEVSLVHLYDLDDIDLLITGSTAESAALSALAARGLETVVAP